MSTTISGDLISHTREIMESAIRYALNGKGVKHGYNAFAPHAISAYIITVAAFEAFLNEILLSPFARNLYRDSSIWDLSSDFIEKMELKAKTIILPKLLFGQSYSKNKQPFQDFSMLVRIRNDIVHYKMKGEPKYVSTLVDKNVAMSAAKSKEDGDYPWPNKLSTTEGIRWANNTICKMVKELGTFIPEKKRFMYEGLSKNFVEIPLKYVKERILNN